MSPKPPRRTDPPSPTRACALQRLAAAAVLAAASAAAGAEPAGRIDVAAVDLMELSLEQLVNIDITSVSKHAEPAFRAAAAVFVLTGEEIRRSGVRTLADALRLVPGVQVNRGAAYDYSVSARGLGADKLEVVMNGRSVYSPLTSIVYWETLDTYLPDVERIEVIRGPGATLWGANAVNGVINIITRSAADTVGGELQASAGNEEIYTGAVRWGTRVGDTGALRLTAKSRELDNAEFAAGGQAQDGMRMRTLGFRYDGAPAANQTLQVHAGAHEGRLDYQTAGVTGGYDRSGGNAGAQWTYSSEGAGELSLAGYWDHYKVDIPGVIGETRDTVDLAFQQRRALGAIHDLTWGAGARWSRDRTAGAPAAVLFDPQNRSTDTYNLFVQDQIRLGERGELTLGSKFEHNDFTGTEVQPGIRLGWSLRDDLFTWGSVARAVRLPNRLDHDVALFCSALFATLFGCTEGTTLRIGSPDFDAEKLTAYEWGLRWSGGQTLSVDFAAFYNDYSDLRSEEALPLPFGSFANQIEGTGTGAEISAVWIAADWLELRPYYAYLDFDARARSGSTDLATAREHEGNSARHKAGLRVSADLAPNWQADLGLRHVGRLRTSGVPAYTDVDLRIAWQPRPALELALIGQGLFDPERPETSPAVLFERSAVLELTWKWR